MKKFLLLAILTIGVGCESRGDVQLDSSKADSATDFLKVLLGMQEPFYTFPEVRKCWVQKAEIPFLLSRLDSTSPAPRVVLPIASSIRGPSMERDEAAFLIAGYRKGMYPPAPRSEPLTNEAAAEIRNWWARGGEVPASPCAAR